MYSDSLMLKAYREWVDSDLVETDLTLALDLRFYLQSRQIEADVDVMTDRYAERETDGIEVSTEHGKVSIWQIPEEDQVDGKVYWWAATYPNDLPDDRACNTAPEAFEAAYALLKQ